MRLTIAIETARRENARASQQGLSLVEAVPVELPPTRAQSSFLAHLAGTYLRASQTRERRRADPRDAARAYIVAAHLTDV